MGIINYGNQNIHWDYESLLTSSELDAHHQDIIPVGIYKGGKLVRISDVSVNVLPLVCQISDGTYQARIETTTVALITVAPATPYVILRWSWSATTGWYMDILAVAVGAIATNDLVVGMCIYVLGVLTGFDYSDRSAPYTFDQFLKTEELSTPAMKVFVNKGRVCYGDANIDVAAQESPVISAPASNPRIDLIYIDNTGLVQVDTGTENPTPSPNLYGDKIVIAEVTLQTTSTTITNDMIKDVRQWINLGGSGSSNDNLTFGHLFMINGF